MTPSSSSSTASTSRTTATCAWSASGRSWSRPTASWCASACRAASCTPEQYLASIGWRARYGNGSLRLTTRQTFQLHGVPKRELRRPSRRINERAARHARRLRRRQPQRHVQAQCRCSSPLHGEVYGWARRALSEHLLPRTRAYHEIWLDGDTPGGAAGARPEDEPIYGRTYLPRKFKIGIAVPPSNDVDVFANDLGFIAIVEGGRLARLQRERGRRHGHDPRRAGHLSAPGRRHRLLSARGRSPSPRRC